MEIPKKSVGSRDDAAANAPEVERFQLTPTVPLPVPDHLYHLGLDTTMDLKAQFGDLRCAVLSGSGDRVALYAAKWASLTQNVELIVGKTERFKVFKVGNVLFASHGMGMPSLNILLHELVKLLHYAQCPPIPIIRAGTSGGIGVPPGTAVITSHSVNGELEELYKLPILGKVVSRSSDGFCPELVEHLFSCRMDLPAVVGKTMSCDCFYEGQGRVDGAICGYTVAEKLAFLRRCHEVGVRNVEMEANLLGAFGKQVGLPVACVCVTLVNRLDGDQVWAPASQLAAWVEALMNLVMRYLLKYHRFRVGAGNGVAGSAPAVPGSPL
eukprot:RCo049044